MERAFPVLAVRDLSIRLPAGAERTHAVRNVSFEIARGETLCVVGESGSGKSVLAQAVMGLLSPAVKVEEGGVALRGEELVGAGKRRMRALRGQTMGMIFQEPFTALNPAMTVGRQIDETLRLHTRLPAAARRAQVLDLMERVRLPDVRTLFGTYPHELSGGQRQRVLIAAAVALRPALLIADEPTTALDVTTQAEILRLLKDVQREHDTALLFITHDFGVVAEIADSVAVMREGQLVEKGQARQVLCAPCSDYTRALIRAVPSYATPEARSSAQGPTVVSVDNLGKVFRGRRFLTGARSVTALDAVSFTVRQGETLGVIGESGSGKSTLARCIARLVPPDTGSVEIGGLNFAALGDVSLRRNRRRIQIVFQDPFRSLNPRRTIGASLIETPLNYGWSRADALARARSLLTLTGMDTGALDRFPHEFSGGQRQRICIARALAVEPDVLVADEALSALDVSVQAQILELLRDIRQRLNLTVIFITHDLRVAAQLCDRLLIMKNGGIVEHGPTAALLSAPRHDYTRALIDAAPGRDFPFLAHDIETAHPSNQKVPS